MRTNCRVILLLAVLLIGATASLNAQIGYSFLSRYSSYWLEHSNASVDSTRQMGLKPWRLDKMSPSTDLDFMKDEKYYYLVDVKLRRDHLLKIEGEDFILTLNPLANFSYSHDFGDTTDYQDTLIIRRNTRAFLIQGQITDQITFQSSFHENQVRFPGYVLDYVHTYGIVPGQGRHKDTPNNEFDFAYSTAWVNYRPVNWLDITVGNGKHFIGHGYRSILLSDAAFNMPYAKATAWILKDKVQWTSTYAGLQNLERLPRGEVPESLFKRKALSWQYLSFVPTPRLELGIYNAVVWERWTEEDGTLPVNWMSVNPLPVVNSLLVDDERHNALIGLNLRFRAFDKLHVYGQYLIDDLDGNKGGRQVGFKLIQPIPGMDFMAEYNSVDNGAYGFGNSLQAYTHTSQSLAHPAGTGFDELVTELRYQRKRWIGIIRYIYLQKGNELNSDLLSDQIDTELFDLAPVADSHVNHLEFNAAYYLNPQTNLRLELSFLERLDRQDVFRRETRMITLALKTSIFNEYYDF